MKVLKYLGLLIALPFILLASGCGGGSSTGGNPAPAAVTVSGVAAAGAPLVGTVKIKDMSSPAKELTTTTAEDGSFSFDVSSLSPPFILRATGTASSNSYTLHSFSSGAGTANINPLANLAVALASGGLDPAAIYDAPSAGTLQAIAVKLPSAVTDIQTKLQPLLTSYNAANANPLTDSFTADHTGLDEVLDMVKVEVSSGAVTISNKSTNDVIVTCQANSFSAATVDVTKIPAPQVRAVISPVSTTISVNGTVTFAADVLRSVNKKVTWSVVEAGGGTITDGGVYTAPAVEGTYHVKAQSVADPTWPAIATVKVIAGQSVNVSITPASPTVAPGGSQAFTATVTGASNQQVTWSVVETGGGSVTSSGVYTAPATAGTYHVKAASAADPAKSATVSVTVAGNPGGAITNGTLKWQYKLGGSADVPAIGNDGTIYLHASDGYLYSLNQNGTFKWKYFLSTDITSTAPSIGKDGTIYVVSSYKLYAMQPDGTLKWKYILSGTNWDSSVAIANDGTIYVGSNGYVDAINPDGTSKWSFHQPHSIYFPDDYPDFSNSTPAIGSDGTIYIGSRDNFTGGLYAINPDGTLKWKRGTFVTNSTAIGNDGTIYYVNRPSGFGVTGATLYALTPTGSSIWSFALSMNWLGNPSIGGDGTIYLGGNGDFYAISPDGTLKWKSPTGSISDGYYSAIGQNGKIFTTTDSGIYVFNPDGTLYWKNTAGSSSSSPAVSIDGTVYVSGFTLYAISSDSLGLANSPWPRYQKDNQNTGRK